MSAVLNCATKIADYLSSYEGKVPFSLDKTIFSNYTNEVIEKSCRLLESRGFITVDFDKYFGEDTDIFIREIHL